MRMIQHLNIPLQLIEVAAREKHLRQLKVLLAFKFAHGGQVRLQDVDWQQIGDVSGYSDVRTLRGHLEACMRLNWIGTDGQWLFIRSFERLRESTGASSRTAVEITRKQVSEILEYALPAKIQSRARAKRHARKKAGAKPMPMEPYTSLDPAGCSPYFDQAVSCSLIGQWYGISASSASRLKARAKKAGYTTYRHRWKKIGTHRANFGPVAESIDPERLTIKDGQVAVRLTDLFYPALFKFKTRAAL